MSKMNRETFDCTLIYERCREWVGSGERKQSWRDGLRKWQQWIMSIDITHSVNSSTSNWLLNRSEKFAHSLVAVSDLHTDVSRILNNPQEKHKPLRLSNLSSTTLFIKMPMPIERSHKCDDNNTNFDSANLDAGSWSSSQNSPGTFTNDFKPLLKSTSISSQDVFIENKYT